MILCFNCSRETKEILDRLLASGQYNDYTEVISVAVANLSILESEIGNKGALVLGDHVAQQKVPTSHLANTAKDQNHNKSIVAESKVELKAIADNELNIPQVFLWNDVSETDYQPMSLPSDVWIMGQEVPIDRWLFGQYNRLLPAKANCRALARLLKTQNKGVLFEDVTRTVTPEAAILGDYLKQYDKQYKISRDELLSTAFPTTDKNSEKSYLRYANQFIGNVNKEGQVSGLLIDLKLVNRTGGKKVRIHLTEPGWHFASMPNPVLDSLQDDVLQKFSEAEVAFLINHITHTIPAEDFAYRTILKAILDGANTPNSMDEYLQEHVAIRTDRKLSSSFLSTQRSGAVSRMTDLGLVKRVRDGVKVSYKITDLGKDYFEKGNAKRSLDTNEQ